METIKKLREEEGKIEVKKLVRLLSSVNPTVSTLNDLPSNKKNRGVRDGNPPKVEKKREKSVFLDYLLPQGLRKLHKQTMH